MWRNNIYDLKNTVYHLFTDDIQDLKRNLYGKRYPMFSKIKENTHITLCRII